MDPEVIVAFIALGASIMGALIGHYLALRQFRREQLNLLQAEVEKKTLSAYQKFWTCLLPASYFLPDDRSLVVRREGQAYLNQPVFEELFAGIRDFTYSENGIFLSREMRKAIFEVRDFIEEEIVAKSEKQSGLIKISNTKAKKIENGFDWIRKNARRDVGLEDARFPSDKLEDLS
jgi:hypothetical protein